MTGRRGRSGVRRPPLGVFLAALAALALLQLPALMGAASPQARWAGGSAGPAAGGSVAGGSAAGGSGGSVAGGSGGGSVSGGAVAALVAAPKVTAVSPAAGPVAGATRVTITGANLANATKVLFGTVAGTRLSVVSSTQVQVTTPMHAAGVVNVRVTTPGGTSAIVTADRYAYVAPPKVTALSPATGPAPGGTLVTITGANLARTSAVIFGTSPATAVTVVSATTVTAVSPGHVPSVVDVRIVTPGGTSAVVAADRFSYIATGLTVSGRRLYRDGFAYTPRGFNMVGVLSPAWCVDPIGTPAAAHLNQDEMSAAAAWHATTLRLQVSQRGLADPTIAAADRSAYLQHVEAGVSLARGNGFDVILSMQDQSIGCGSAHPFPTQMTVDAWNVLAPVYAADPYVMFELFNEPNENNTAAGWNQWQNGGTTPSANQGSTAVGMQALLDGIRGLGNTNVVIVDGLNLAERLSGFPALTDATGNLMYAIHPYAYTGGQAWWDPQYGTPSASVAVIATEWDYMAVNCGSSYQTLGPMLLQYLHDKHIGVLGHALDVPGTSITGAWDWTPTDCATGSGGSGKDLLTYLTALNSTDAVAPAAATGVHATVVSGPKVNLTWTAATDNVGVATYRVIRDGFFIALTTGPSYSDTSMSSGHTHTYQVYAVDAAYNVSPVSNSAVVTVP